MRPDMGFQKPGRDSFMLGHIVRKDEASLTHG